MKANRYFLNFYIITLLTSQFIDSVATTEHNDYNEDYEWFGKCENGNYYPSLSMCLYECTYTYGTEEPNESLLDDESSNPIKVIELTADEFSVGSNGQVHVHSLHVTDDSVILNENRSIAYVCYPLNEDFNTCEDLYFTEDEYELRDNSKSIWIKPHKKLYSPNEFFLSTSNGKVEAAICVEKVQTTSRLVIIIAYSISVLCLLITLTLSMFSPKLNMRHNHILMCHMFVLTWVYIILLIKFTLTSPSGCLILAVLKQFCVLASFFWINVQAIDLFLRFINLHGNSDLRTSKRKFMFYSIYAWGSPAAISAVTIAMEYNDSHILHPSFYKNCWFTNSEKLTALTYFYGPIALILCANVLLFILTINKLHKVGKTASTVNKKMHNQLLQLYLKLVVVMGLCWIMEVISWAVGGDYRFWILTDTINALQGSFIFLVYICKPSYMRCSRSNQKFCSQDSNKIRGHSHTVISSTSQEVHPMRISMIPDN